MSDVAKLAIEAQSGSWRLGRPHFRELHQELFGEGVEVSQATAEKVVERMKADPELSGVFKPKVPKWEDLKTRREKSDFVDRYGVDAFLDLARRAHL